MKFAKHMFCQRKVQENAKNPKTELIDEKNIKIVKRKYKGQKIIKPKKMY